MRKKTAVLSDKEREVLILAAVSPGGKHLSNSEISQRLGVSVTSVKTLMHQACAKLEVHSRNEAIFLAFRRGEISLDQFGSLDELAGIFVSLGPDVLRKIAHFLRQGREDELLRGMDRQVLPAEARQEGTLTNRERDVLIGVAQGLTNREIADTLCVSVSAVKAFLNRACTKLGVSKRTDALVLALKRGEITIGEVASLDELSRALTPLGADRVETIAELVERRLGEEPLSTGD